MGSKLDASTQKSVQVVFEDFFKSLYISCRTTAVQANFPLQFLTVKRRILKRRYHDICIQQLAMIYANSQSIAQLWSPHNLEEVCMYKEKINMSAYNKKKIACLTSVLTEL
jgi:hypothetical protein